MKTITFHPDAEAEMHNAAVYYETQKKELGKHFIVSVQDAINRIRINPEMYPIIEMDVRRCLTKTFPFGIFFRDMPNQLVFVAVMHLHRDPNYWRKK